MLDCKQQCSSITSDGVMKKLNIFFFKKSAVQHSAGYSGVILQQKFSHALRQINASSA